MGKIDMKHGESPLRLKLRFRGEELEIEFSAEQPVAVLESDAYEAWINSVTDSATRARIVRDVGKMRRGLVGDWKEVEGIFEMRLDYGPGYRVYYAKRGNVVIILLGGGDKSSQKADLRKARRLWEALNNEIKEV